MHPMLVKAEAQLRLELEAASYITHPGESGRAREGAVRHFLRSFIPDAYGIDTGFVTDVHGTVSSQVDIIVYRRDYHPVFEISGVRHFMVESVAAVIENKAAITSRTELRSAMANIASVKRLDKTGGGRNYVVMDFHGRGPNVTADTPEFLVFGGILTQKSLALGSFVEEWTSFTQSHPVELWPNSYADIDAWALLYLTTTEAGLPALCLYPQLADSFALTEPTAGTRPFLDFARLLADRIRTAAIVDYQVAKYFPASSKHRNRVHVPPAIIGATRDEPV